MGTRLGEIYGMDGEGPYAYFEFDTVGSMAATRIHNTLESLQASWWHNGGPHCSCTQLEDVLLYVAAEYEEHWPAKICWRHMRIVHGWDLYAGHCEEYKHGICSWHNNLPGEPCGYPIRKGKPTPVIIS